MSYARLTSVRLAGFKSFAVETELSFGEGLTGVIGPNGSGKSNLAEAIRWVLGEQSAKQLRAKERIDVIFAGSNKKGPSQKAEVALRFDNSDSWFPLDAAEVEIARVLTRAGESRYVLNGEDIRLSDLQQLLAEAGIGAKSFTVISQGMVDQYLTAGADKRAELFDEATGVKGLQMQLAVTERKLEASRVHAHEVRMVLEELRPRLEVLGRQMARAVERERLEGEFETKQTRWLKQEWYRRMQWAEKARVRVIELQEEIEKARGEREKAERLLVVASRGERPSDHVKRELWQAESELKRATEVWQQRVREREQLEKAVAQTSLRRGQAEEVLAKTRELVASSGKGSGWREAMEACVVVLREWRKVEASQVAEALQAAEAALESESVGEDVNYVSLMAKLEQPLQEVARLSALEEEQKRQLAALTVMEKPDDGLVRRLREQLAGLAREEKVPAGSSKQLAVARDKELAAEREGSAAQAALEGSNKELAELEEVVLRERGSEFWQRIQEGSEELGEEVSVDELREIERRMSELGTLDPLARKEFEEVKVRQEELSAQLADIEKTEANIRQLQVDLSAQVERQFAERLEVIAKAFGEYFGRMFGGGQARLQSSEEGIEILVQPPGKKARHMGLLSGGERALTSLALLMAILEASEPPFIVLDEVDAALDEANSRRLSEIVREKSEKTQCIMITHNRESMARAERLYGVTMQGSGVSKVYSVSLSDLPTEGELVSI